MLFLTWFFLLSIGYLYQEIILLQSESSRVRFLVQIRDFVLQTQSLGLQYFDMKRKTKRILVVALN